MALSSKRKKALTIEYEAGDITLEELSLKHKVPLEDLHFLLDLKMTHPLPQPTVQPSIVQPPSIQPTVLTEPETIGSDEQIDLSKLVRIKRNILNHLESLSQNLKYTDIKEIKDMIDSLTKIEASIKGTNDTPINILVQNIIAKFGTDYA